MIETRQPDPAETPVAIGACRAVTITAVTETGWWDTPRMMADIKAGGGAAACQWRMRFDPDNAAGSCSLIEVEGLDGVTRRILLDAGWNADYMAERFRSTGVARLLAEGGIDFLLLSHEHLDHFWGIEAVLRLAPAIPILVPGTLREEGQGLFTINLSVRTSPCRCRARRGGAGSGDSTTSRRNAAMRRQRPVPFGLRPKAPAAALRSSSREQPLTSSRAWPSTLLATTHPTD